MRWQRRCDCISWLACRSSIDLASVVPRGVGLLQRRMEGVPSPCKQASRHARSRWRRAAESRQLNSGGAHIARCRPQLAAAHSMREGSAASRHRSHAERHVGFKLAKLRVARSLLHEHAGIRPIARLSNLLSQAVYICAVRKASICSSTPCATGSIR